MFDFTIVVNDNGELKTVTRAELAARSPVAANDLERALNSVLDDRSAAEEAVAREAADFPAPGTFWVTTYDMDGNSDRSVRTVWGPGRMTQTVAYDAEDGNSD